MSIETTLERIADCLESIRSTLVDGGTPVREENPDPTPAPEIFKAGPAAVQGFRRDPSDTPEAATTPEAPTFEALRNAAIAYAGAHGREGVKAAIAKIAPKAEKISGVPESKWAALLEIFNG